MANKFERVLEAIINGKDEQARGLFHDIVVEKSRKIYESLHEEDGMDDIMDEVDIDDTDGHEDIDTDEEFGGDEADDLYDETRFDKDDDAVDDGFQHEDSQEDAEDEHEVEDRVVDLEDAFDELKAEFEEFVNDSSEHEEAESDAEEAEADADEEDADALHDEAEADEDQSDEDDDFADDEDSDEDFDEDDLDESIIREYVEKVTKGLANKEEASGTNTVSPVIKGKNDMGGTVKNTAQGSSEEKGRPTPKSDDMTKGKEVLNRPGADAGKKGFSKKAPEAVRTPKKEGINDKSPY